MAVCNIQIVSQNTQITIDVSHLQLFNQHLLTSVNIFRLFIFCYTYFANCKFVNFRVFTITNVNCYIVRLLRDALWLSLCLCRRFCCLKFQSERESVVHCVIGRVQNKLTVDLIIRTCLRASDRCTVLTV